MLHLGFSPFQRDGALNGQIFHGWEPQSVEVYAAALHGGHKKSESVGSEYKK